MLKLSLLPHVLILPFRKIHSLWPLKLCYFIVKTKLFKKKFFFFFFLIFGCAGPSLMHVGFLQVRRIGAALWLCAGPSLWQLRLVWSIYARAHRHNSRNAGTQLPHGPRDGGPGMEPVSPALADRFLTTGPPGKSQDYAFNMKLPIRNSYGPGMKLIEKSIHSFF